MKAVTINSLPTHEALVAQIKEAPIKRISGRLKRALRAWDKCAQHLGVAKDRLAKYKATHTEAPKKPRTVAKKK